MNVTRTDLAWLAGFMDGEGTIGLHRSNAKSYPHPYIRPTFQVPNTDMRLIKRVVEIIEGVGCKASVCVSFKGGNGCKKAWRARVHAQKDLVILLPLLIPYLVSKDEQARLALEFCMRRSKRLNTKHWYEFKAADEAAYTQCLLLNKRGDGSPRDEPKLSLVVNG